VLARGSDFFARPGWMRELTRLFPSRGTWETPAEADGAVVADIRESFQRIARECPNPAQHALCYPWYARSRRADALAAQAGARLLLGGIDVHDTSRSPEQPPVLQRLPPDFLSRLPGRARRGLAAIIGSRGLALAAGLLRRREPDERSDAYGRG
jgi:hypothetical protein